MRRRPAASTDPDASGAVIRFTASLAAVMHPIKKGRDGARVTIDVPMSDQLAMMKLELMTDMAFEVIIKPIVTQDAKTEATDRYFEG